MRRREIALVVVSVFVLALAAHRTRGADGGVVSLGRLTTDAVVDLASDSGRIEVAGIGYPYFAGDRIATRSEGGAALSVRDGVILLGPTSAASVAGSPRAYRIDLERGALRVRGGSASSFEVATEEVLVRPRPTWPARAGVRVDLVVALETDGAVTVRSHRGSAEVARPGGAVAAVVDAGATRTFAVDEDGLDVDISDDPPSKRSVFAMLAPRLAAAAAVGGIALGIEMAVTDDDGDDDPPASPVQ